MANDTVPASKGPTWPQALFFFLGGAVLAIGGCAGFVGGFAEGGGGDVLLFVGGLGFFFGVGFTLWGFGWLVVRLVRAIAQGWRGK